MASNVIIRLKSGESIPADIDQFPVIVEFERHFNRSSFELQNAPRLEWLAWLAWRAARNDGASVPVKFDDFLEQLAGLDEVEDQEGRASADPTDGGQ
jgi:hypothetical protein